MKGIFNIRDPIENVHIVKKLIESGCDVRFRLNDIISRCEQEANIIKFYHIGGVLVYCVHENNGIISLLTDLVGNRFSWIKWYVNDNYMNHVKRIVQCENEIEIKKNCILQSKITIEEYHNAVQLVVNFDEFEIVKLIFSYF